MKLFFSVGEPSGDHHAAALIEHLKQQAPDIECLGLGGPQMAAAGCDLHFDLTEHATMGFVGILSKIPKLWSIGQKARKYFHEHKPAAVVLLDFPGFNWWMAHYAKEAGVPVVWYCPPQIWAWGRSRIRKMQRLVDYAICPLPFEHTFFTQHGIESVYVGHPFFEASKKLDEVLMSTYEVKQGPLVTLLPGSRTFEVQANTERFLNTAKLVAQRVPNVHFAVAAYKPAHAEQVERIAQEMGIEVDIRVGKTSELIQLADCCLAVSGSVSLELLASLKPTVIHYRLNNFYSVVFNWVRRVKYITLVNLLAADELHPRDISLFDPHHPQADQVPFPEYLTVRDRSTDMANHLCDWLLNPQSYQQKIEQLRALKTKYAQPGASARVASQLLQFVNYSSPSQPAQPHFITKNAGVLQDS